MFDLDLSLAVVHHIIILALFAVLAAELLLIRPGMTAADVGRVGVIDGWYGALAVAILAVGFGRAVFAAKGWEYYSANPYFHVKLGAFVVVGLLSIIPTAKIIAWRRRQKIDATAAPALPEITLVRRAVWAEVFLFLLMPAFAAAMARGSV
ncbi:MAG: DUF2214 family protein [Hyphomicrobiales bacterium]|nr:DUF2214 family protein [Hyphomicrobiales bacterium]